MPFTTLAYSDGPILAFAQDGLFISWETNENCVGIVRIRSLLANSQRGVGSVDSGGNCDLLSATQLVEAGPRAFWTNDEVGNEAYTNVYSNTFAPHSMTEVASEVTDESPWRIGNHLGGLAVDTEDLTLDPPIFFSTIGVGVHGSDSCDTANTCIPYISGGGVSEYLASSTNAIPGVPPASLLAASGGNVAIVPASIVNVVPPSGSTANPVILPNTKVLVVNGATGAQITSFTPAGTISAIAYAGSIIAVIVVNGTNKRVQRYSASTGALLGSSLEPAADPAVLAMDSTRILFLTGDSIRAMNTSKGSVSTLAIAASTPIGLSLSYGRVAWGENVTRNGHTTGRIQALQL